MRCSLSVSTPRRENFSMPMRSSTPNALPFPSCPRGEQKPRKPHFPTGGVIVPFRRRATASKRSWSSSALPTPMISPSKVWGSPFPTSTGSSPMEARFAGATSTTSRTISPKRRSKNGWPTWASTPPTTPPTAFFPNAGCAAMASDACSREVRCSIRNPTTRLSPRSFSRACCLTETTFPTR